jgi:flavin reductase
MPAQRSGIDVRQFRDCLGHFATGVTVVTSAAGSGPHGMTVNSFTSVSMDPPLVLVSLARTTKGAGVLEGRPFVINVLRSDQLETALHFAGRPQDDLRIGWEQTGTDHPRLGDCLAWIECNAWRSYDGGDHILFLGEVVDFEFRGSAEPLLFYQGAFRLMGVPCPTNAPSNSSMISSTSSRNSSAATT